MAWPAGIQCPEIQGMNPCPNVLQVLLDVGLLELG